MKEEVIERSRVRSKLIMQSGGVQILEFENGCVEEGQ